MKIIHRTAGTSTCWHFQPTCEIDPIHAVIYARTGINTVQRFVVNIFVGLTRLPYILMNMCKVEEDLSGTVLLTSP
jgi:hypothetical protein